MARVALGGVGAPEDDQVAAVPDLAQGAGHLADVLKGDARGPVANAGRRVDAAADPVADRHRHALGLGGRVAEPVDDRVLRLDQDPRGAFDPILHRGRLAFDQAGRAVLVLMTEEPRLPQNACTLGLGDAIPFDFQRDVVADAAAESAGGVLDDLEFAVRFRLAQTDRTHRSRNSIGTNASPPHQPIFSSSTSNPLLVGMPEPCVSGPSRRLERSP